MKLFRQFLAGAGLAALALSAGGCLKAPSYSSTPEISFEDIKVQPITNSLGNFDSLTVTVHYQDGDGDLGLSDAESRNAPYVGTPYINNYFVEPYVKVNGQFVRLADINRPISPGSPTTIKAGAYNSRFEHISTTTDNHALPLKGSLNWGFSFYRYQTIYRGEEVRFQVYIVDRALHVSNTITTESVTFSK